VFQSATKAAASRAQSIASELQIDMGGIRIEADIRVSVKNIEVKDHEVMSGPATRLHLEWEAARLPRLFPLMKADLSIYPITATETQLDFNGLYEPPLGPLGKALNAMVGHRIAEVSVHRFVSDLAGYLRKTLARGRPGIERLYPTRFSKPEVQISLSNSFNQTVNALSITISPEEAKEIEAQAAPGREKVRRMLEEYQSRRGNGDSEASSSVSMAVRKSLPLMGPFRAMADSG